MTHPRREGTRKRRWLVSLLVGSVPATGGIVGLAPSALAAKCLFGFSLRRRLWEGGFSVADPNDAGMLDVVGSDTATPNLISGFSR